MPAPPRSTAERIADTRILLHTELDCWVASASVIGDAYLIPLSFLWDDARLLLATPRDSRTARDLQRAGQARIALGPPRDVVLIDATVAAHDRATIDPARAAAFAARHDWDPRAETGEYAYLLLTPTRIRAWREANELPGRTIMRDGHWLA